MLRHILYIPDSGLPRLRNRGEEEVGLHGMICQEAPGTASERVDVQRKARRLLILEPTASLFHQPTEPHCNPDLPSQCEKGRCFSSPRRQHPVKHTVQSRAAGMGQRTGDGRGSLCPRARLAQLVFMLKMHQSLPSGQSHLTARTLLGWPFTL